MEKKEAIKSEENHCGIESNRKDRWFEYWFASIGNIGHKVKKELRSSVASAKELYYIEETKLSHLLALTDELEEKIIQSRKGWDLERQYEDAVGKGIQFVCYKEPGYPKALLGMDDAPYVLFYKGKLPDPDIPAVGIVGARRCSGYGEAMAKWFAEELVGRGVQIISGLAKGIDGMAGRGALSAGGETFGVLGCGVDICYPRDHIGLYHDIILQGGIISEYPVGASPLPMNFPLRNRIISGMSDAVLVVEAKRRSGSLITADFAMEQGKDVFAVPGPLDSELSYGCNRLIKQGAGIVLSPEDFMEELEINYKEKIKSAGRNKITLESKENMVYSVLDFRARNVSELIKRLQMPVSELMNLLISLELKGYIREISKNNYVKIK